MNEARPIAAALAERLRRTGEGMCALVLKARDPAAAGAALRERALKVQLLDQGAFELEASSPFGTRVIVESEA